jgi:uncharacterized protein
MNPVCYFEIPVTDMPRAMRFYTAVFGYDFEEASLDGHAMAFFPLNEAAEGVSGALCHGESYVPGHTGSRVYFRVSEIEETLSRVVEAGGQVLYPKKSIGDLGWVAEFEDSEGNLIALHSR